MCWKQRRWKAIVSLLIAVILVSMFCYALPERQESSIAEADWPTTQSEQNLPIEEASIPELTIACEQENPPEATQAVGNEQEETVVAKETPQEKSEMESEQRERVSDSATDKDKYLTEPVPEGKPMPVEPQEVAVLDTAHSCTISISCATILENWDSLDAEKAELVPEDGWILPPTVVTFYEGESVFPVLQRVCKQNRIHMEFENTPIYNSAYIEGIGNLYEFDCGALSGWMYQVNDWFPNYGCSRYQLKEGDVICWLYTCDLGSDIGGAVATKGE